MCKYIEIMQYLYVIININKYVDKTHIIGNSARRYIINFFF